MIKKQENRQAQAEAELKQLEEQRLACLSQGGDSRVDTEETEAKIRSMQETLD